ncbi:MULTISPECIES: polysaccharide deacetylase family protein [Streptomycetaceae]|uniref:Secreted deacetylase n=1 Tax=Streptantibioticus cattleyicolor (strain ATCC 35852 / DSM 46488 / JCM 4925 / NBRC 14057 / NRRL 8057) TaxID=1003195 RepID=F8K0J7_STREN
MVAAWHIGPAATWLPPVRRVLWPALDGRGRADHVALTFDDGPDPVSTPLFLDTLDRLGVRATFFVLGRPLRRDPWVARELVARGHEVAVHGWEHRRPWRPGPRRDLRETGWAVEAVTEVCGTPPRWYRPPYGILTGGLWAAARHHGLRPVLWSAWGRDWVAGATARGVLDTLAPGLRGGATVLLHDSDRTSAPRSWQATHAALPALISRCRELGLTVGPLSDHQVDG